MFVSFDKIVDRTRPCCNPFVPSGRDVIEIDLNNIHEIDGIFYYYDVKINQAYQLVNKEDL